MDDIDKFIEKIYSDNEPSYDELDSWHKEVLPLLVEVLGKDSQEIIEFKEIRFRIPPAASYKFDKMSKKFKQELDSQTGKNVEILDLSDKNWKKERLSETREILLMMLLEIRNK